MTGRSTNHPGASLSIVLRGGYREIVFNRKPREGLALPATMTRVRRPGSMVFRRAKLAHRLELLDPRGSWSLFLVGPKLRDWGFYCATKNGVARWVPWQQFTAGEKGELIGRGCS